MTKLYDDEFEMEIFNCVRGGFPLININSREVDRVTECLKLVTETWNNKELPKIKTVEKYLLEKGYDFSCWDSINGWQGKKKHQSGAEDIELALKYVVESKNPGIFVMQNFHLWLDADRPEYPMIIQLIREVYKTKNQHKHLFFVGVLESIPIEIKDYFIVVDFNLPTEPVLNEFIKEYTEDLGLSFSNKIIKDASSSARGMSILEAEGAVSKAVISSKGKNISRDIIFKEKAKAVKKSNLLEYMPKVISIEKVGGLGNIKMWAEHLSKVFKEPAKAKKYNLAYPKGCLLMGIQGCGKSLIAKTFATQFEVPLYYFDVGKVFAGILGETERNSREVFKLIDSVSPCCILMDEIDKSLSGLGSSDTSDAGATSRFIGSLLSWMEEKTSQSFIIATANNIGRVPPELLRKGRFDELWFINLPNEEELMDILKIHIQLTGRDIKKYKKLREIVKKAEGFTGSEVENIIKSAMFKAFYEDREYTDKDLLEATSNTIPLSKTKKEEVIALQKWAKERARMASGSEKVKKTSNKLKKGKDKKSKILI